MEIPELDNEETPRHDANNDGNYKYITLFTQLLNSLFIVA
jgi:hypothetical protein